VEGFAPELILSAALALSACLAPTAGAQTTASPAAPPAITQPIDRLDEIDVVGERPGPRLWKVMRDGHVLWVLGTLNHVPRKMVWQPTEVESALNQSQQVLPHGTSFSADIGPFAEIRLYFQYRGAQKNPGHTQLKDWLPAPLYARFEVLKQRFDPHDSGIEELRPSFAALRIYQKAIEAAGLTEHDEIEKTVLKLASKRHVPVRHAQLVVEDPADALKEVSALPPSVEISCLETTVTRLETDLPLMQERARAWAVGDVNRLRQLPFPDQREACISAMSNAPRVKALIEQAAARWDSAAEAALANQSVSFAMRPIYDLLAPSGTLARFRAEGATVEGP
jgi:uncharacterized protein YbaP (TraB family)